MSVRSSTASQPQAPAATARFIHVPRNSTECNTWAKPSKNAQATVVKTTKLGVFPVFAVFYCWCAETRHFKTFVASNFSKKKNIGRVNRIHKQQLSRFSQQAIPFDLANRNTEMLIAKNAYQSRG